MDDSNERYYVLDTVAAMRPSSLLDVGCGCGEMTVRLAPLCGQVTAIDRFDGLIERCRNERPRPNVVFLPMDARSMTFPDMSFQVVLERDSLHHIDDWRKALAEMMRVAQLTVLIEEPIDDPRSDAKRAAEREQALMLELQHEVGYPHYRHIPLGDLLARVAEFPFEIRHEVFRCDETESWDEHDEAFGHFVRMSNRQQYWVERRASLRRELGGQPLGKSDRILIVAMRR